MVDWECQTYDFGTIHRANGADGDWSVSCPFRKEDGRVRISFGLRIDNYKGLGISIATPSEVGRFGSVEEAMMAAEIWENPPGHVRPAAEMRAEMGFGPYIDGLERRGFSRSTELLFTAKPGWIALTLSSRNWENIGLLSAVMDNGEPFVYPGRPDADRIQDVSAAILCDILRIRLSHPYDRGRGVRTPVSSGEFAEWLSARGPASAPAP